VSSRVDVIDPGVVRISLPGRTGHVHVFFGKRLALVDCGGPDTTQDLLSALAGLELPRRSIALIVLTHEHAGHAGASDLFPDALVLAHPLAAAKLRHGAAARPADLELEHGSAIRLGGFSFDVLHTPGHTSGAICLYERSRGLLVTGDTAFARGNLPVVARSGSRGEHLETLERLASLRARIMLPGHGAVSDDPAGDLAAAAAAIRRGLAEEAAPSLAAR
jgi:hydroxyacylglutathione hydrolase